MLNFGDVQGVSKEKATDHIEIRVKPSDKERIAQAANLLGVKRATFVKVAAAREAERVLVEQQTTVPSQRDTRMLLEVLDNPPPPTPAARDMVRSYRARIVNAG